MLQTPRPFIYGGTIGFACLLIYSLIAPFFADTTPRQLRVEAIDGPIEASLLQQPPFTLPPRRSALMNRRIRQDLTVIPPKPRLRGDVKHAKIARTISLRRYSRGRGRCLPASVRRMLAAIDQRFGRVRIISTYRRGATIAGTNRPSYHRYCRAVDFKVRNQRAAVAWLRRNWRGGVGTYSGSMHHVHIDNGRRVRFHHRVGRSGRPSARRWTRRRVIRADENTI